MNNDREIDIEIQLSELKVWADRSLFYLAKMFTDQIKPGESYRVFKKCVSISILNFTLFPEEAEFREKAIRDYNEGLLEAEERGRKHGTLSIAKKLIDMGYPTDEIEKITLLSKKDIEKL